METKKIKLVTHNGTFHADDIFACATLSLILDRENISYEIFRTRDEKVIEGGDIVFDVGGVHDAEKNRFDHHQPGGAGKRENGVEYASFGLVWQKFGETLCDNKEVAAILDGKLVAPIDAGDNGMSLAESLHDIKPYFIQHAFKSFRPTWQEESEEKFQEGFLKCVEIARDILVREITKAQAAREAKSIIAEIYKNTKDKRILILDKRYPWEEQVISFPEVVFVVFPRKENNTWGVEGVMKETFSFEKRKKFPSAWAGLREQVLANITGVKDAVFCHRGLFMAVAKSREGAVKLAEIAIKT